MSNPNRSPSPEFSPLAMGENLAPLPEYKAATTTALDFDRLLAQPLKLHEDLKTGCGGQLWPAGIVLAKHMLRYHREKLDKARMWVSIFSQPPLVSWTSCPYIAVGWPSNYIVISSYRHIT
jgi:hypothetical protein